MTKVTFAIFLMSFFSVAHAKTYLAVGKAQEKKVSVAFTSIRSQEAHTREAKSLEGSIRNNLRWVSGFRLLPNLPREHKKNTQTREILDFSSWKALDTDFLIQSSLSLDLQNNFMFEAHIYEIATKHEVLAKKYYGNYTQLKNLSHLFSDQIMRSIMGLPGIFRTRIAMSCDRTGKKEIYMMNFDGTDVKQITHHRSVAFAPAWSRDNKRIAYSVFTRHAGNIKNIDLYEFDLKNNTQRVLSARKGINSGAAYAPDGKQMALTLSYLGNPEIFLLDLFTRHVVRLTRSLGVDVDPSWSPDGSKLACVASRTGASMIFSTSSDGKKVQRLTFAGKYNATPCWSPQRNQIVFSGWSDNHFDIFTMDAEGTQIERLTKNQGNNEDPVFSPDGNLIAFSSNRSGHKNIYIMDKNGTFVRRITYGLGNCVSPKWSFFTE